MDRLLCYSISGSPLQCTYYLVQNDCKLHARLGNEREEDSASVLKTGWLGRDGADLYESAGFDGMSQRIFTGRVHFKGFGRDLS
jgi:hypothetical protein